MRFNTLFFVVVLSCICLTVTQGFFEDCCLKYVKEIKPYNRKHAINYKHQRTDGGCNIPAVIFSMRRGRKLCADPTEKWAQELMIKIDRKIRTKPREKPSNRG